MLRLEAFIKSLRFELWCRFSFQKTFNSFDGCVAIKRWCFSNIRSRMFKMRSEVRLSDAMTDAQKRLKYGFPSALCRGRLSSEPLTNPCLSEILFVSFSLWKETTFCIHCSPVAGESGWMYILLGISGSAFPATIHRLKIPQYNYFMRSIGLKRVHNGI